MHHPMNMKALVPTRALALLMLIGFVDLFVTASLHSMGVIQELNPLMRVLIEQSEFLFGLVKAGTLIAAWIVMARYAQRNLIFVRRCCLAGSAVYVSVWSLWFFSSL